MSTDGLSPSGNDDNIDVDETTTRRLDGDDDDDTQSTADSSIAVKTINYCDRS